MGVEPTKETAAIAGMIEEGVDGHLVAVHYVEHPVRQTGFRP